MVSGDGQEGTVAPGPAPSATVAWSPCKPRPDDPLAIAVADTLRRIEVNYDREGSGPGSRFEGRLLEDVQARSVIAMVRAARQPAPAVTAEALAAAPEGRPITVRVSSAHQALGIPARPRDLAVQLLSAIDRRLAGDPPGGLVNSAQERHPGSETGLVTDDERETEP
jgi:hypothetical protein